MEFSHPYISVSFQRRVHRPITWHYSVISFITFSVLTIYASVFMCVIDKPVRRYLPYRAWRSFTTITLPISNAAPRSTDHHGCTPVFKVHAIVFWRSSTALLATAFVHVLLWLAFLSLAQLTAKHVCYYYVRSPNQKHVKSKYTLFKSSTVVSLCRSYQLTYLITVLYCNSFSESIQCIFRKATVNYIVVTKARAVHITKPYVERKVFSFWLNTLIKRSWWWRDPRDMRMYFHDDVWSLKRINRVRPWKISHLRRYQGFSD